MPVDRRPILVHIAHFLLCFSNVRCNSLTFSTDLCVSDEIRNYFGETVAMYFAFLGFYTYFLIPPAVLGIVSLLFASMLHEDTAVALFCVFNLVWATVFLESWKRRTAELAYGWGTIRMEQFEEPRAAFYGVSRESDPVTGRKQPYYPNYRRLLKFYLVSVPTMFASLCVAFFVMLFYFWLDAIAADYTKSTSLPSVVTTLIMLLPTIVYALVITLFYAIYRPLAIFLNNWGKADCVIWSWKYDFAKLIVDLLPICEKQQLEITRCWACLKKLLPILHLKS